MLSVWLRSLDNIKSFSSTRLIKERATRAGGAAGEAGLRVCVCVCVELCMCGFLLRRECGVRS